MSQLSLSQLRWLAVFSFGASAGVLALASVLAHFGVMRASAARHFQELSRQAAFLRLPVHATSLFRLQVALLTLAVLALTSGQHLVASLLMVPALLVTPLLQARRARRVAEMEEQLDPWLSALASTLRATPALGEALEYTLTLVPSPLRDELDVLVKELKLGVSLDSALTRMGERIGSKTVTTALSALRIGQRTGGDIPKVAERSASALREMARLEGVVRVKTAEGKAQAAVLALLPFPLISLLTYLNPGFLAPLVRGPRGYAVIFVAFLLWVLSLVVTRRILRVDI
jgi:tight adherence protein B